MATLLALLPRLRCIIHIALVVALAVSAMCEISKYGGHDVRSSEREIRAEREVKLDVVPDALPLALSWSLLPLPVETSQLTIDGHDAHDEWCIIVDSHCPYTNDLSPPATLA